MGDFIRVLLVDAFALVRQGLVNFLHEAPDLRVIGETSRNPDVLNWCLGREADVILFNPDQSEDHGVEFIRSLHRCCPGARTIALGEELQMEVVRELLNVGVSGYLLKNATAEEVVDAIRAVYQGQGALAPEVAQLLLHRCPDEVIQALTAREWEVLQYLIQGLHNEQIAERLVVTVATVKAHLHHLFAKLGVSNRTQAVAFAIQHQLPDPHDHSLPPAT